MIWVQTADPQNAELAFLLFHYPEGGRYFSTPLLHAVFVADSIGSKLLGLMKNSRRR